MSGEGTGRIVELSVFISAFSDNLLNSCWLQQICGEIPGGGTAVGSIWLYLPLHKRIIRVDLVEIPGATAGTEFVSCQCR